MKKEILRGGTSPSPYYGHRGTAP